MQHEPRRAALAAAVALQLFGATAARAGVISEDPLQGNSTEAGVIARAFHFVLAGETLEPPFAPQDMSPTGIGILDLRLYVAHKTPAWQLVIHNQLTAVTRSHAGGGLAVGRGVPPPRWLPLRADTDEPTLSLSSTADWIYAGYNRGAFAVTAGRQPITFGRAALWRPSDLVSSFSLTEVDTEYKPGADALRVDWAPSARAALTLVAAAGELEDDGDLALSRQGSSAVARGKYGWDRGELGAIGGYVRGDAVIGLDGLLDAAGWELYGEATLTLVTDDSLASPVADAGEVVPRAVAGATFRHGGTLTLRPELWLNGFGAVDEADYLAVAQSPRVAIGEQVTMGRAYAVALAEWEPHPLLHVGGLAATNLLDPSALLSIALTYSVADNAQARIGGYLPIGEPPDGDGALPRSRSEYGLYPHFGFVELKLVL